MINIVVPMAGLGSRFAKAGYAKPKPLIEVHGIPMMQLVIENLRPKKFDHRFIFIVQRTHVEEYQVDELLKKWAGPKTVVIQLDGLTDGAARTVLASEAVINSNDPLMIANCDQYVDIDIDQYLEFAHSVDLDGAIMTMKADDPKWSFARLNEHGFVDLVVEKEVISNEATVGIYNFRSGADFVRGANLMIARKFTVNGEYYVAPVYNDLIALGAKVKIFDIGSEGSGMYGLGIPADLEKFINLELSRTATQGIQ
ncbi:glycosyltransferase family 2 protein [Burkholderia cenocepacia]|uniref:glycosyltransferase family 2 protein n=1 Tax=Burkholderia cenocepacia TaxID=95486 RepID=UPI00196AD3B6|nr:glycosyltransferase family 2 protein [Burkholderia cenocepacia]MBN3504569.1 glycosyltransferase family 2 protein [Burkholderia cenocepacia]MCO1395906.1 glycosyltransferase family 2 protein [Burkholderia cenocepacia]MCO1408479.1 glycosyltransferase family 2 protein [Burkholderia cenocepacia]UQN92529.1 glycosyltransferase family 2 protein [Burkholderia cenocepacia]UQN99676.1 glycosyltransferase family 2 protein [Burkholderia cenocepacia]